MAANKLIDVSKLNEALVSYCLLYTSDAAGEY